LKAEVEDSGLEYDVLVARLVWVAQRRDFTRELVTRKWDLSMISSIGMLSNLS